MARSERTARSVLALSAPRAVVAQASNGSLSLRPGLVGAGPVQGLHKHRNVSESMEHGPEFDSR